MAKQTLIVHIDVIDSEGYLIPPMHPDGFLDERVIFDWESQVGQYPADGRGMTYFRGDIGDGKWVDCLLRYNTAGTLVGILNFYPQDVKPFERRGNVNVFIHPDHRRTGIGRELLTRAVELWRVPLEQQRCTRAGAALVASVQTKREARS